VGIVEDDAVAALAGRDAADRGRDLVACLVVLNAALAGLERGLFSPSVARS
jgi:hypothetical protein